MTDPTREFERLLARSRKGKYVLRLYIAGSTPRSSRAVANIRKLCEAHLKGRYELTVVDLYQTPKSARTNDIIAAPTLVKQLPLPVRKLIGDLSSTGRVLLALDIKPGSK